MRDSLTFLCNHKSDEHWWDHRRKCLLPDFFILPY